MQTVDHLGSPWRMEYILEEKPNGCVFCDKLASGNDDAEHVLTRGCYAFITLNRYPYNNGHLLIVPYVHAASPENLPVETLTEMMLLVNRGLAAPRLAIDPPGFYNSTKHGKGTGPGV